MEPTILKRDRVRVAPLVPRDFGAAPRAAVPAPAPAPLPACEKSVRPVRDGATVVALELTCSCGEVTVIELTYDGEPDAGPRS